jgi:hypothetical protein
MPKILNIPEIKNLSEARESLPDIVGAAQEGAVYVIKSPRGQALVVGLDEFKELQEAYLDLEGRLESIRMLEDKGMREALAASFDDEAEEYIPLSKVRSRYLSEEKIEEGTEEGLKNELVARMNAVTADAVAAGQLAEEDREVLLNSMAEAADKLVRAAASAAGVAAAKAAEEITSSAVDEAPEEVVTKAAEAAEETAERFLLSRQI